MTSRCRSLPVVSRLSRPIQVLLTGLALWSLIHLELVQAAETIDYNRQIRPILSDRCFPCHGPDAAKRKAGLRLDTSEGAFNKPEKSDEFPIVPRDLARSSVYQRLITKDEDDQMPPPKSKFTITPAEIELIRKWIEQGAPFNAHWAFEPLPAKIPVPSVRKSSWPKTGLDHFVLSRLEKEGIEPAVESDKPRWLRRVTYDLTGLPPTPAELDAFLADTSNESWGRVVDRLLSSPHFGERMALPWLDAARYGDSYGYQSDQLSPTWPWRDWVVRAFNDNLPYDKFLTWQIAGDLLPGATRDQKLATGFNRLHRQTNEGGSIEEEWRTEYAADRVHTLGTAVLGLTMECARCHDHKYDPVTMRDYYSLSAFFNSIDESGLYFDSSRVPTPSLLLPTSAQEEEMEKTARQLEQARADLKARETAVQDSFVNWAPGEMPPASIPGLVAAYPLDSLELTNRLANSVNPTNHAITARANSLIDGRNGKALLFTGDDELTLPNVLGSFQPWDRYTVAFWLRLPAGLTNGVIFHRTDGTDVGFHGTELSLQEGRLFFVIKRFWPGNAIAIRTTDPVPHDQWIHIAVSYDGSVDANGMRLYLNGAPAASGILRNRLTKSPANGGSGLVFGQRFRSSGLKGGAVDDIQMYERPLAPVEIAHLVDGQSLERALKEKETRLLADYYKHAIDQSCRESLASRKRAIQAYYDVRNPILETMVMEDMPEQRPTYVLARGQYDAPKTEDRRVTRNTFASFAPMPQDAPRNRLGLAAWLTDPGHPLTARVAVNRVWQQMFGRGFVTTTENFGQQGSLPSHPDLINWLARDFVNSGWNVKTLVRNIALSSTYRQTSAATPAQREKDPENILLSRGPSHRLPAEMIRDTALAASGLIDLSIGGPPVSPYQPGPDLWRESNTMSPAYRQSVGKALHRRSIYSVWKRTSPLPNMVAFDAPSREVCTVKRPSTSTPLQAFVLLNDIQFVEAARALAERSIRDGGPDESNRIRLAFRFATGRSPDEKEMELLTSLHKDQLDWFRKYPDDAEKLLRLGEHKTRLDLPPVRLAAATVTAQAILNLDAAVWKR